MTNNNNIYDLIDKGDRIIRISFGYIEHYFNQSLLHNETIKAVKVRGADGKVVILRYSYYPDTEHLNHIALRYEKWIDQYFERL